MPSLLRLFFATDLRPVDEARKRQQEESLVVQTSDDLPSPQNQLKISKVVEILSGLDDEKNTKILINHGCEGVDVSNFVPYGQPPSDQQRLHGLPSNSASSELGVEMGPDNLSASRMLQSLPASPILKDTLSDVSPNMAQSLPASPINGLDDLPTTPLETCKDLQNSASKVLINGAPPFKAFKKRRSTKVSQVSNGIARSYSTGGFPTPKEDVSVPDSEEHETYLADLQPILRTNSNVSTRSLMSMKSTRSLPVTSSRTLRLGSVLEPRSREDLTEVSPPRTTRMGSVLIPNSRVQGGIVALEEISPSHEKKLGSLLKPSQNLKKDKVPFSPRIGSLLVPPTQASTSESFSVDVCKAQKLGSMLVPPPCDEVEVEIENHLHHIDTIEKENQIRSLLPKVQSVTTRTGRSASRTTAYVQSDNVSQFEKRFQERERRILENNDEYFMIDRWTSPWRHTDHELASKLEQREKRQNFLSNNYVLKTKGINAVEVASTFRKRIRANRPYPNITQQWKISFEERSAGHSGFYDLDYIEFYEATVTGTVGNLLDKIPWEHRNVPRNFFRSYEQSNFFGSIIRRRLSKRIFQPVCHPKSMLMPMEDAIPEDGEWLEDWYTTWEAKRSDTNNLVKHFDNDYDDKTLFSSMTGSTSIPSTLGGGTSASVSRMTSSSGPGSRVSGSVAFGIMSSLEDSTEIIADIQKLDPPEVGTLNTVCLAIGESSSRVTWEYTSSLRKSRWRRKFFPRNTFPY
uniref:Uncharacterized protein n=2 Tax=Corethron hystrix TaxID=216773 RepID=A0A7S1BKK6_9STRA